MGSVKKKLTKTLRKITPKEIAPILPFIAMALPGIGGIASNALLRYGLPQLLTAAGSARTSGKINPLNQALAAFASYAAAPDAAGQLTGKEKAFLETDKGMEFLGGTEGAGATGQALKANPSFAEAVKASNVKSATPFQDLFTGATRMVGDPIRDLGAGNFNFKNLATVGGLGGTAVGADYAAKALAEAEAENERLAGLYGNYDDAVISYIDAFGGLKSDPFALYRGSSLFAAKGGLIPPQRGPMPQGMNQGGIMSGIPQTQTIPKGMQVDGRGGGFIPMGAQEKKDDVPAMLAKNEFVMTSDAVKAAGGGSVQKGAQRMYDLMNSLEAQV